MITMLIVDMPMPTRCDRCPCALVIKGMWYCKAFDDSTPIYGNPPRKRRDWCPIKGVLVRCGECEYHGEPHRTDMGVDVVWCNFYNTHKLKDGYCNCGERKDGAV